MAIKKTRRELKAEQNQSNVMAAIRKLFAEYDFDRITVDDICAEAGVSKSTFYSLYESKQDLLMLYISQKRFKFLGENYSYDDSVPFKELFSAFLFANFRFNQLDSHASYRDAYISYIKTYRQEWIDDHYYLTEMKKLVERGMREDAFKLSLSLEEHLHLIHDWLIGFLIGWSLYPDNTIGINQTYDHILHAMVNALVK